MRRLITAALTVLIVTAAISIGLSALLVYLPLIIGTESTLIRKRTAQPTPTMMGPAPATLAETVSALLTTGPPFAPETSAPIAANTTATAPPATTSTRAPSFNKCQTDATAGTAPNFPIRIAKIDKLREVVTLQNVSSEAVNLDGWVLCSITGSQRHPGIGGTLRPEETRDFPKTGGAIWNNSSRDDGALYTPTGQLVSYYEDHSIP